MELFRTLNLDGDDFCTGDAVLEKIPHFTPDAAFENKSDWKPYAERLERQLTDFMADDFDVKKNL